MALPSGLWLACCTALLLALPAKAQEAVLEAGPTTAPAAMATLDTGDTSWMLTSTLLVLLMIIPGIGLFYGGLVRSKNMLSVLTHTLAVAAVAMLIWVGWGYSLAFTDGNAFVGGLNKLFLAGVTTESLSGTIPEYLLISFQMTFCGHHRRPDCRFPRGTDQIRQPDDIRRHLAHHRLFSLGAYGLV